MVPKSRTAVCDFATAHGRTIEELLARVAGPHAANVAHIFRMTGCPPCTVPRLREAVALLRETFEEVSFASLDGPAGEGDAAAVKRVGARISELEAHLY